MRAGIRNGAGGYITEHNVFDLPGRLNKYELYYNSIFTMSAALEHNVPLSASQRTQAVITSRELPPRIQTNEIPRFLAELTYPLCYLDFETYMHAIPEFDGTRLYMQIPFQYSLHIKESEVSELKHREFLAKESADPRRAIAECLCRDIPDSVCTLAHNMSFEKTRLRDLADSFPDLSAHLMSIHDNMHDLMIPFTQQWYYCKKMQGSYSIKYVLPALCPDDSELDYHALDGILNGSEATDAFPALVG